MLIVGARSMLIVGAALFINGRTNYQHENVDSWCSTIYKWCMLIVGAQHNHCSLLHILGKTKIMVSYAKVRKKSSVS